MRLKKSLRMAAVVTGLALAMTACASDDDTGSDADSDLPEALADGDISVCNK